MSFQFKDIAARAAADGSITAAEVLALRQAAWPDGKVDPAEAEAIFDLNDKIAAPCAEWSEFFVEALGEMIVNQIAPKGYVDDAQADWLIKRIDHDGKLDSLSELELLVKVLEKATDVPARLKSYALGQIEAAVLTGEGPTRSGESLGPGRVTETEARLLRRMIFAQAGDRPAAVGRSEAEMLFRLKDATLGADNSPEWKRLFVQGVGNYLAGFSSYAPLSIERASELETFMDGKGSGVGRFLGRMAKADIGSGFTTVFGRKGAGRDYDAEVAAAEAVTGDEQLWLQGLVDADDTVDAFEQALLDFLAEEAA